MKLDRAARLGLLAAVNTLLALGCGDEGKAGGGSPNAGGVLGSGGDAMALGGAPANQVAGGRLSSGGLASAGTEASGGITGGTSSTGGGASARGGAPAQGGGLSGGAAATGGSGTGGVSTGGASSTGGSPASIEGGAFTGGSLAVAGGAAAVSGAANRGGTIATGGSSSTGGWMSGGSPAAGGVPADATNIYYVAPEGNDAAAGALDDPWATVTHAVSLATPGTLIYVRGGTYLQHPPIAIKAVSGTASAPIRVWAYQGETPVLDFNNGSDSRGIAITMSYWHVKGLIVQNAAQHGITVSVGSYVTIENCTTRYNGNMGLNIADGVSYATILNCDSYGNYDVASNGENADGFGAKYTLGPGNVFRGCRAWDNADDGWDLWGSTAAVRIEDCWAFRNGMNVINDPAFAGDGNGFKLGTTSDVNAKHVVVRCVSWDNRLGNGFEDNKNAAGVTFLNCTGYRNAKANFEAADVGPHVAKNNISLLPTTADNITAQVDSSNNSWNGLSVTGADFQSLDDSVAAGPRAPDGSLPVSAFLHLTTGSLLIDMGADVGLPYLGSAPDLGAFETR